MQDGDDAGLKELKEELKRLRMENEGHQKEIDLMRKGGTAYKDELDALRMEVNRLTLDNETLTAENDVLKKEIQANKIQQDKRYQADKEEFSEEEFSEVVVDTPLKYLNCRILHHQDGIRTVTKESPMMVWHRMDNGKEQRRHKSSVVLVEKSAPKQADGSTQNIVDEKPKSFHPGNRVKIIWDRTPVPGKSTQGWTKTVGELEKQKGTIEKVSHHSYHSSVMILPPSLLPIPPKQKQ